MNLEEIEEFINSINKKVNINPFIKNEKPKEPNSNLLNLNNQNNEFKEINENNTIFSFEKFFKLLENLSRISIKTGNQVDLLKKLFLQYYNDIPDYYKDKFIQTLMNPKDEDFIIKHKSRPYIRPSEISDCELKIFFDRLNYPKDKNIEIKYPYSQMMADIGSLLHLYIQMIYPFDKTEINFYDEDIKVKGKVDAIIGNTVIEIKTVSDLDWESQDHIDQALIYSYVLNKNGYNINSFEIAKLHRNLKDYKVLHYDYNNLEMQERLKFLLYKINKILNAINTKNPISLERDYSKCIFCPFKDVCKKLLNNENKPIRTIQL